MSIKHFDFFHGFAKVQTPETQRPCARLRDADRNFRSASGDPAMVFIFRMASILSVVRAPCPAQRPDCCWTFVEHDLVHALRMIVSDNSESGLSRKIMRKRAQLARAYSGINDECCAFRARPCNAPRPSA